MKVIVLYCRRNVGMIALSLLKSKGYRIKVISDDENVIWLGKVLKCEFVTLETMGDFDLFLCVHGNKIVPKKYLIERKFVNVHPCLSLGYKGHNPIKRFIADDRKEGTVDSHFMSEIPDEGVWITGIKFKTPDCKTYADFYNYAFSAYYVVINKTMKLLNICI